MRELGETIFDIVYLISILSISFFIISTYKNKVEEYIGYSLLVLGFGDAFHLIPRMVSYRFNFNFVPILGIGNIITSITMTLFYLIMYYIYIQNYKEEKNKWLTIGIWILFTIRVILCLFIEENGWLSGKGDFTWSIIRNIPFIILGIIVAILYFIKRKDDKYLKRIWLYVILSFIFYICAILLHDSSQVAIFMILKTICYILISVSFLRKVKCK